MMILFFEEAFSVLPLPRYNTGNQSSYFLWEPPLSRPIGYGVDKGAGQSVTDPHREHNQTKHGVKSKEGATVASTEISNI